MFRKNVDNLWHHFLEAEWRLLLINSIDFARKPFLRDQWKRANFRNPAHFQLLLVSMHPVESILSHCYYLTTKEEYNSKSKRNHATRIYETQRQKGWRQEGSRRQQLQWQWMETDWRRHRMSPQGSKIHLRRHGIRYVLQARFPLWRICWLLWATKAQCPNVYHCRLYWGFKPNACIVWV